MKKAMSSLRFVSTSPGAAPRVCGEHAADQRQGGPVLRGQAAQHHHQVQYSTVQYSTVQYSPAPPPGCAAPPASAAWSGGQRARMRGLSTGTRRQHTPTHGRYHCLGLVIAKLSTRKFFKLWRKIMHQYQQLISTK